MQVDLVEQWLTGGPTKEQFWASFNAVYGTDISDDRDYTNLSSYEGYSNTLYFPHKEKWNNTIAYWLASVNPKVDNQLMLVFSGGLVYDNVANYTSSGIRPLVCLPSNAKADWNGTAWELSN